MLRNHKFGPKSISIREKINYYSDLSNHKFLFNKLFDVLQKYERYYSNMFV